NSRICVYIRSTLKLTSIVSAVGIIGLADELCIV
ncbi:unnamed protein product, partial [Rotaria sp. Silwood2]